MVEKNRRGINKPQEVEPIKNVRDINKIKQFLLGKENKRDYLLFVVGINVGLRAGDLLKLKIDDVIEYDSRNKIRVRDNVIIIEEKTDKRREFTLNNSCKEAIMLYIQGLEDSKMEGYLFKSRKGDGPLTVEAAHKLIKNLMRELNIKGNYGTHSLRKTFAYHTYINNIKTNPGIIDTLQKILNHSSSAVTLRYIGITKEVITDVYNNLNL